MAAGVSRNRCQICDSDPKKRSRSSRRSGALHGPDQLAQVGLQQLDADSGPAASWVVVVAGPAVRRPETLIFDPQRSLTSKVRGRGSPLRGRRLEELLCVLPADGLDRAAAVAEHQPQPGLPVSLAPQLPVADGEDAFDSLAGCQLATGPGAARAASGSSKCREGVAESSSFIIRLVTAADGDEVLGD